MDVDLHLSLVNYMLLILLLFLNFVAVSQFLPL